MNADLSLRADQTSVMTGQGRITITATTEGLRLSSVGDPEDRKGQQFLAELARASGGRHVNAGTARLHLLSAEIKGLLAAG